MVLARILFGAAFTLAASYSIGRVCLWRVPAPRVMALPTGGAILSLCIYLLLLLGVAVETAFVALGICAALPLLWRDKRPRCPEKREPVDGVTRWLLTGALSAYGVLYLVNALAPETQPDAAYYHLGLVSEYLRLGTFPDRIDFYEILPQGMEMLYLFAFAFGEHPAAKLVHFAFLVATGPVLVALGRKLGISDTTCWIAVALYWLSPVVGISGTCAYTDAALALSILACFYFLLEWRDQAKSHYLVLAGLMAGFCYTIKLNALLVPALAILFVLVELRRYPRLALAR